MNLLSGLLRQVIEKASAIPSELYSRYRKQKEKETRPSLSECLKLLRYVMAQFFTVFVVVDALDECSEVDGTRSNLIKNIRQLLPKIRLFCTSRSLPDIEHEFKSSHRLEIRATDRDIRIYLETRIQQEKRLRKHVQADPTLLALIVDKVTTMASGMFVN